MGSKIEKRGGKRPNAGRKLKKYETVQLRIHVPKEIEKDCKTLIKSKIKEFLENKYTKISIC